MSVRWFIPCLACFSWHRGYRRGRIALGGIGNVLVLTGEHCSRAVARDEGALFIIVTPRLKPWGTVLAG